MSKEKSILKNIKEHYEKHYKHYNETMGKYNAIFNKNNNRLDRLEQFMEFMHKIDWSAFKDIHFPRFKEVKP